MNHGTGKSNGFLGLCEFTGKLLTILLTSSDIFYVNLSISDVILYTLFPVKFNRIPPNEHFSINPYTLFFIRKVYKNIRLRFAQILGAKNFKNHVRGSKKVCKSS